MQEFETVCEQAARAGGAVLMEYRGKFNVREKAPADLVTEADISSQEAIRALVLNKFPEHNFVGEEDTPDQSEASSSEFTWIVDPLDGTTNYVHGLENYCVSVALQQADRIVAGAIFDPIRDHCFRATLGGGAFCNERPLRVSGVHSLDQALVAASLPARVERDSDEITRFADVMVRCQAIRRLGSAALNLCYVAAGQLDAYWATSVKKWDVAAGLLIVSEAGGVISNIDGSTLNLDRPRFIAASQTPLQQQLVAVLGNASIQS